MIVDFPYLYKATVFKKRSRNSCEIVCLSTIEVDIPEITDDEAPLVASARAHPVQGNAWNGPILGELQCFDYRRWGNSLMRCTYNNPGQSQRAVGLRNNVLVELDVLNTVNIFKYIEKWSRDIHNNRLMFPRRTILNSSGEEYIFDTIYHEESPEIREWLSSGKEQALHKVLEQLSASAFVNGEFFQKSDGPVWLHSIYTHSQIGRNNAEAETIILIAEADELNFKNRRNIFSNKDNQELETIMHKGEHPYVFDGELVSLSPWQPDTLSREVIEHGKRLISMLKHSVGCMNLEFLTTYMIFREDLEDHRSWSGDQNAARLGENIKQVALGAIEHRTSECSFDCNDMQKLIEDIDWLLAPKTATIQAREEGVMLLDESELSSILSVKS